METPQFRGVIGDDWRAVHPVVARGGRTARRGPERAAGRPRRRRLRPAGLLRVGHRHAHHRPVGRRGHPPHQLPHHRAVLPHPGLPADGPEPPPQRPGPGGRPGRRVPRVQRRGPQGERLPLRGPPPAGLRHLRRGQVAPDARRRDEHGRPAPQLAAGPGVRPLVRVPRRGDPPVRAGALPRQPLRPTTPLHRRRLPPERRPGRPGHRPAGRPARGRCRPPLLPVLRHRRLPLAPPCAPRRGSSGTQGRFDKGWDEWREELFERQLASGMFPPGTQMAPRPPWVPAWSDLPGSERRVAARFMECFAAFLSYTDDQLGRVVEFLERDR